MIVGLDGATFDVLLPLVEQGRMPRLKGVLDNGASGTLWSTVPPITPAAWTTFLTGRQPGAHGIIDFERYDPTSHRLQFNSSLSVDHVPTIWRLLGDRGLRVGSVNVPMTYPARPVNGFMVSGFETPGVDSDFVHPPEIRDELLVKWSDPTQRKSWRHSFLRPRRTYQRNIDYISRTFHQGAAMTMWLGDRFGWDALMVVLKMVDNLQHKTWRHIDPRWSHRDPWRHERALAGFEEADRALGTLLDYAEEYGATVMIVSDHGHGSLEGKVYPNALLERWGYLRLRGAKAEGDALRDLPVDFARTKACVMHAGMAGFLYINLKGRQPAGVVAPSDYESLRDELRRRFLGDDGVVVDPSGQPVPLFKEAHKPEELYGCSRKDQPWMPDLLLIPRDGLAVVRKMHGRGAVRWLPYRRIEGTHRSNGVFAAVGPGIRHTNSVDARLLDCAPTILAMLGMRIPAEMEGRVITDAFSVTPTVERAAADVFVTRRGSETAYSEAELRLVTERLSDLGYLE